MSLAIWTIADALGRLEQEDEQTQEALGVPMLAFASIGLVFNVVSLSLFWAQGIPTCSHGSDGQLNLCAAAMHLIGDTVRMIVILGSGIFIVLFDKEKDSGTIDAYCAILVSIFTMIVTVLTASVVCASLLCERSVVVVAAA